jgi:hypothetical protein
MPATRDTGRSEVYLAPVFDLHAGIPLSTQGGTMPRWNQNGTETLFLSLDRRIMSVEVTLAPVVEFGTPRPLFQTRDDASWRTFDLAPDGRLLEVVPKRMGNAQPLTAMINWTAGLTLSGPGGR